MDSPADVLFLTLIIFLFQVFCLRKKISGQVVGTGCYEVCTGFMVFRYTIVFFADGRQRTFNGEYPPIRAGRTATFTYNILNRKIYKITES